MSVQAKYADCLWHVNPELSEIRREPLDLTERGGLLLQSLASLVSVGTESTVACGRVPGSLLQSMRVPYMQGSLALPCTYGYSLVAKVVEGPADFVGKHVHTLHPHQSITIVNVDDVSELPAGVSPTQGVLVSNVETVINAIWDSQCQLGEPVVIAGFGSIGALLALTLNRVHFGRIYVVEPNPKRAVIAEELGLTVIEWGELESCAVAFNVSASEKGLQACIEAVGFEGRVIELSWYGTDSVNLKLGHEFHSMRKQIISSQVSSIPLLKRAYWTNTRRKQLAYTLIAQGIYDRLPKRLVRFSQTPELFKKIRQRKHESIITIIEYE